VPAKTESGAELGPPNPQTAPQQILELPEEALFVLKDFGCYLQSRTFAYFDIVLAWLSEIRDVLAHTGRTVIFVGVDFDIPPACSTTSPRSSSSCPTTRRSRRPCATSAKTIPIDEATCRPSSPPAAA
jgi:hypothetical protein